MFSVTNTLAGFDDVLTYLSENLIFAIIIAVCLLAIIVICVILIVSGKKAEKNAHEENPATEQPETVKEKTSVEETEAPFEEENTEKTVFDEPLQNFELPKAQEENERTEFITEFTEKVDETDKNKDDSIAIAVESKDTDSGKTAYSGKWVISKMIIANDAEEEMDSAYFFQLKASNGEPLITSEEYTSLRGATAGIETFKSNIAKGNFKISMSKKGKFIVKLLTSQGSLLTQGEKYSTHTQALNAIASIKRFAATAVRSSDIQETILPYEETAEPMEHTYSPDKKGKWVIRKVVMDSEKDASYCFELRASNGQMLFTSEEYATVPGLKNGIKTHINNIAKGNIKAVITRNGDYIFKIFTGNGQLLCLGEHYKTKQLCLNAIESVKRFSKSAPLNLDDMFPEE